MITDFKSKVCFLFFFNLSVFLWVSFSVPPLCYGYQKVTHSPCVWHCVYKCLFTVISFYRCCLCSFPLNRKFHICIYLAVLYQFSVYRGDFSRSIFVTFQWTGRHVPLEKNANITTAFRRGKLSFCILFLI